MATPLEVTESKVFLPNWNIEITLLTTPKGPYYVIRELCLVLGIKDVAQQAARLRTKRATAQYIDNWPVQTRGGKQEMVCIHRRAVGYWFGTIDETKCRAEVQDRIVDLQVELVDAADRVLFGEVSSEPARAHLVSIESQMSDHRRFTALLEQRIGHLEDVIFGDNEDQ
jgi:hypothetical protein